MKEIQLTSGTKGHFLHNTQCFSPDDQWIVYDTRNKGAHIGRTCCIEMVNVESKEIQLLYQTKNQTIYGPGVGAATFNTVEQKVLFIHGLQNSDSLRPYGFTRRTGVAIKTSEPQKPIFMDARDVIYPYTPGALRGGTHAHSWNGDGQWVSFTYNDDVMAQLEKRPDSKAKDLRMVGVMAPYGPVNVNEDDLGENINGNMFTVVVTRVTENPKPGSNEIEKAYEDGWVGVNGYIKEDGSHQKRAVAFLGDLRVNKEGKVRKLTEVFIVDIPEDVTKSAPDKPLEGTKETRPNPPMGMKQRRLTFTENRKYMGVQGPRHWLRSTPNGSMIFFMMKDNKGLVQIYGVSPNGGDINKITDNDFSVETGMNVSPDGKFLAYGSNNYVYVTEIATGVTRKVSPSPKKNSSELRSINWSNNGKMITYNRKVATNDTSYYQIFLLK